MTYEKIEAIFTKIVQYGILFIELIGVLVLFWAVLRALVALFRHGDKLRLQLAEGIALALEFKMGGELLRTVIVREWSELLILGAVILLRAAMTFLIQWEIHTERRQDMENEERSHRASPFAFLMHSRKHPYTEANRSDSMTEGKE